MKIAFFNCNARSIPPRKSGGIEKVIYYLAKGAVERGHDVTVFSTKNSCIQGATLVASPTEGFEYEDIDDTLRNRRNALWTNKLGKKLVDRQEEFDIIHNHCLEAGLKTASLLGDRCISTIHEYLDAKASKRLKPYKDMNYISISISQRVFAPDLNYIANIYHGIDVDSYPVPTAPEGYLVFIGRISAQKRPDLAILAAAAAKKKLIIVGNYKDKNIEGDYYQNTFLPVFNANKKYVDWIGELDEDGVKKIVNKADALLLPVAFPEPFGLAAIEAMAAGCPVVAFRRGAYQETVIDGKTGFLVDDLEGMIDAIKKINTINRAYCRQHVKRNFSVQKMVDEYIKIYELIASRKTPKSSILDIPTELEKVIPAI
jgi:glycosyltransferase involved in cell wall biosynthesis